MKKINLLKSLPVLLISVLALAFIQPANQDKDWEILFDGNNMDKWKGKNDQDFMKGWKIEDGLLFLEERGGDILTKEKYSNFELVFEFKLTKEANSGIKYFVNTVKNVETGKTMINGPEYQIIDDYNYKNIKDDPNGTSSSGAAYLLYAPKNKKLNPHGEWNSGKIVAKGKKVEHWLNDINVVIYKRGNKDFLERKSTTKFKNDENYGEQESGHIMLTDHGDVVYFKNIKIRKL
jgi:hypothetical protein